MALNVLGIEVGQKDDEPGKMPTINIPKKARLKKDKDRSDAGSQTDASVDNSKDSSYRLETYKLVVEISGTTVITED